MTTNEENPALEYAADIKRKGLLGAQRSLRIVTAMLDDDGERMTTVMVEAIEDDGLQPMLANLAALTAMLLREHPDGRAILGRETLRLDMEQHLADAGLSADMLDDTPGIE